MIFKTGIRLVFILLLGFLMVMVWVSVSSCEVLKGKKRTATDTDEVKKETNTGTDTSKGSTKTKEGYVREIYNYLPDTNMMKLLAGKERPPDKNYFSNPVQIIRESGTKETESEFSQFIQWFKQNEEAKKTAVVVEEKTKETTFGQYWWVALIAIGGVLINKLIPSRK